ncbi:uncharacterized protein RAG0_17626 [Rhynchosporium agropyri]|uniref:Uncharacterized protein n=1 Tax=Rhynchosporium agropyri TaxID=914238 RepID=A0A1E1LTX7_9HELO|nr:uncharacterized protein RAG0_17626 [Rhynchosporium agropyri]
MPLRKFGSSEYRATYLGNGVLEVGGAIVATVKKANSVNLRESTLKNALSRIRKFAPANLAAAYPTGYTVFDRYMRAIYPGVFSTDFVPPNEALPEIGLCRSLLGRLLEDSSFIDESKHSNLEYRELYFIAAISVHLRDFFFLITQEGYLGYGSPAAKAGDKICLLLGFNKLIILRSIGDNKYKVVGLAFVNRLINCKGLLGNFPAIFKPVLRRHTKHTGESAGDRDPRLRFESLVDAGCKIERRNTKVLGILKEKADFKRDQPSPLLKLYHRAHKTQLNSGSKCGEFVLISPYDIYLLPELKSEERHPTCKAFQTVGVQLCEKNTYVLNHHQHNKIAINITQIVLEPIADNISNIATETSPRCVEANRDNDFDQPALPTAETLETPGYRTATSDWKSRRRN